GALPLAEALEHCLEIAEALDGGHRQGIAHGSLTAAEVVLTDRGARLRGYGRGRLTRATAGEGETAGRDFAALGAIVSEMLGDRGSAAGAPPLEPPRLDRALARCLATDPAE